MMLLPKFLSRLVTGWSTELLLGDEPIDVDNVADPTIVVVNFNFTASDDSAAQPDSQNSGPWCGLEGYDIA